MHLRSAGLGDDPSVVAAFRFASEDLTDQALGVQEDEVASASDAPADGAPCGRGALGAAFYVNSFGR